jgi:hypothetical protein
MDATEGIENAPKKGKIAPLEGTKWDIDNSSTATGRKCATSKGRWTHDLGNSMPQFTR